MVIELGELQTLLERLERAFPLFVGGHGGLLLSVLATLRWAERSVSTWENARCPASQPEAGDESRKSLMAARNPRPSSMWGRCPIPSRTSKRELGSFSASSLATEGVLTR